MKRRPLVPWLACAAWSATCCLAQGGARAERGPALLRIGWLSPSREDSGEALQGRRLLHEWLRRAGYDEGRNLQVERRYAEGDLTRLPGLAQELVQADVDLIIALMNDAIAAARQATPRIPIVMLGGRAPVDLGFVDSMARPGANVTGVASVSGDAVARALQVLKEAVPSVRRVAVLFNGRHPGASRAGLVTDRMALSLGLQLEPFDIARAQDVGPSLRRIAVRRVDALLVVDDPVIDPRRPDILSFARRYGLVSIGTTRQFAEAGGMLGVGPDRAHLIERTVAFADRILRGSRPQDLPVEEPQRYALIVNLTTAGQIGRELPRQLLRRADEVIE